MQTDIQRASFKTTSEISLHEFPSLSITKFYNLDSSFLIMIENYSKVFKKVSQKNK